MINNLLKTRFMLFILVLVLLTIASHSYAIDIGGTAPIEVETIAELRTHRGNLTSNKMATVLGYSTSGDGGGAPIYIWIESATPGLYPDNNGSIIVPTGGDESDAWIIPDGNILTAKMFGAIGGSTADNSAALTDVDAVGDFTLTAGDYKVSSNITISNVITFEKDAYLIPDSGVTITLEETPIISAEQIAFAGAGDVSIESNGTLYANWWSGQATTTPADGFENRWNEMWDNCPNARTMRAEGDISIDGPLNLTAYIGSFEREIWFSGVTTWTHATGGLVDMSGSRRVRIKRFFGLPEDADTDILDWGLLLARLTGGGGIGPNWTENFYVSGKFRIAAHIEASSELVAHYNYNFANSYYDGSVGYPSTIITTLQPSDIGTGVTSSFQTLYSGTRLSGNGHTFYNGSLRSDNFRATPADTGNDHYGSTIIIDGSSQVDFVGKNYLRSNGYSGIHINCASQDMHNINVENTWHEAWNGDNPGQVDYAVSVYGNAGSGEDLDNCIIAPGWTNADIEEVHISGVRQIRNLRYFGANATTGHTRHGLIYEDATNADFFNCHLKAGRAGIIDLSAINNSAAELCGTISVQEDNKFLRPTNAEESNWIIDTIGDGIIIDSEIIKLDSGTIKMPNLPTADPATGDGTIWLNSGVLTISS